MMRTIIAFLFVSAPLARASTPPPLPSLKAITVEDARKHLSMLADDSMQGRNTPSPQLEIAANYIADRFKEYGLKPLDGSYFQRYAVSRVNLGTDNTFILSHDSTVSKTGINKATGATTTQTTTTHLQWPMEIKTDWVPYDFTASDSERGGIVFAGYGITAPEFHYDDYDGLDVNNKFVLVLRHEPDEKGSDTSFFRGKQMTRHAEIHLKTKNAMQHGAIGIIVVTDPANHMMLKPEGYPWPSLFFKTMHEEDLPISLSDTSHKSILAIHAGEAVMTILFGSVDSLIRLQKLIDSTHKPHSFALSTSAQLKVTLEKTTVMVPNVVGWLQGERGDSDHIVIGAHMDHVGTMHATAAGQDTIYNGADDNASGTTGLLEVAHAFASAPSRPQRSVLFIAFSGEEKGLYGSRAYVSHPSVSLTKCQVMINMDMIGRNDPDSLELGGAGRCPELADVALAQNKEIGMKIIENDEFTTRSDQASFLARQIPVLFFFTGEHKDYHQVSDSIEKINFEKLVRVARLCFRTAWDVASSDTKFECKIQTK